MAKQGGGLESQLIKGARIAAGPNVPIGSIAAAGFEKGFKAGEARIEKQKQEEFERRKLEANALARQNENTNKILDSLYKNKSKVKANGELLKGVWKEQNLFGAAKIKENEFELTNKIKSGQISKYDSLIIQDDLINNPLNSLKENADKYVAFADIVDEVKSNLSSSVSSEQAKKINGILEGDRNIIAQVSKELDITNPNDLLNAETLQKLGYRPADTSGINSLFDATQKAAQSAASKGADMDGYIRKVEQDLSQLTLTDDQYVSAAFDFLGKETPGFTNPFSSYVTSDIKEALSAKDPNLIKDANNSGSNMDEIKAFVHNAMIQGAKDSYESFKSDYADKFETPSTNGEPNGKELLAAERAKRLYQDIKTNPQSLINRIFPGSNFRISGNVVQFYDIEGDEKVEAEAYNLNSPAGIKGLLSSVSQAYYGKGASEDLILDEFDKLVEADKDFHFSSAIFPTIGNLPTN